MTTTNAQYKQVRLSTKQFGDSLAHILSTGGNIVQLARHYNITVAHASKLLAQFCENNPKYAGLFSAWPKNISTGYIYIGAVHTQYSETKNRLAIGQHVIADLYSHKNRRYEIFDAVETVEYCFIMGSIVGKKFHPMQENGKPVEKWYSEKDIELGLAVKFGKENNCNAKMRTNKTRIVYRRGNWLGNVPAFALVNVNYEGK